MKHQPQPDGHVEPGEGTNLWRVLAPLVIWGAHFLFCYVWAAITCEKSGRASLLDSTQIAVLTATGIALALIGIVAAGLMRVRGRSLTDNDFEFEHNTPEERHRFLSHMALMLSVLAAVGVIYVAIPVVLLDTCR